VRRAADEGASCVGAGFVEVQGRDLAVG